LNEITAKEPSLMETPYFQCNGSKNLSCSWAYSRVSFTIFCEDLSLNF